MTAVVSIRLALVAVAAAHSPLPLTVPPRMGSLETIQGWRGALEFAEQEVVKPPVDGEMPQTSVMSMSRKSSSDSSPLEAKAVLAHMRDEAIRAAEDAEAHRTSWAVREDAPEDGAGDAAGSAGAAPGAAPDEEPAAAPADGGPRSSSIDATVEPGDREPRSGSTDAGEPEVHPVEKLCGDRCQYWVIVSLKVAQSIVAMFVVQHVSGMFSSF